MSTVVRSVLAMYEQVGNYKRCRRLEFDDTPVTFEVAAAHLQLTAPHGYVIRCQERGPKGGFIKAMYVCSDDPIYQLPYVKKPYLWYIAREAPPAPTGITDDAARAMVQDYRARYAKITGLWFEEAATLKPEQWEGLK
jgi:hypothetical protein